MLGSIIFAIIEFQTTNATVAFFVLSLGVAFGLGSRPVLSGWVAELFPTQVRSQAASYVRNLFEVSGAIIGPALAAVLGGRERPEGVAERWLVAVSEQGRPGLRADAQRRADRLGAADSVGILRPVPAPKDANWFSAIEVGKARNGEVPFAVSRQIGEDRSDRVRGVLRVATIDGRLQVTSVRRVPTNSRALRVPSEGGTPAAKAPLALWIVSLLVMLGLGPLLRARIDRLGSDTG